MLALDEHLASSGNSSSAGDEDEPNPLDGTEAEPEEFPLQWHGDHWDELHEYDSPYLYRGENDLSPDPDWAISHIERETSIANEDLYNIPTTQEWQKKLAQLSRADLPTLQFARGHFVTVKIPLFRDEETGDDYQIALHLPKSGTYEQMHHLVYVFCPEDPVPFSSRAQRLVKILYHASPPEKNIQQSVELPRFAMPLGTLTVRGDFRQREANIITGPRRNKWTEWTDYQVMLDPEREAMPLWIMCSRRVLRERREVLLGDNQPVFGGLMQSEEYEYDAACILDSVHRLGGENRLSYRDACELVKRTRSFVDPVRSDATVEKLQEIVGGPVPNTAG